MADALELQRARARALRAGDKEAAAILSEEIDKALQAQRQGTPSVELTNPIDSTPTAATGMSSAEKFAAGFGKSGADLKRGMMQLTKQYGFNEYAQDQQRDAPLMESSSAQYGNLLGNVVMGMVPGAALNLAGRAVGNPVVINAGRQLLAPTSTEAAIGTGALSGALQPGGSVDERLRNSITGGVIGGIVQGVPRLVAGDVRQPAQQLIDEGVSPTVGQIRGGWLNRLEEGASSIPFFGDMIKSARRGGVEDFNRAIVNRAIEPIGRRLPSGSVGREAVAFAERELSSAYNSVLPRLSASVDSQFVSDLAQVRQRIQSLPQDRQEQLNRIISEQVLRRFANGAGGRGVAAGRDLKDIESEVGRLTRNYRGGASADEREMGNILSDVQDSFRDLVVRSAQDPNDAATLQAINRGWAVFKRAQRASAYAADADGVFTPAKFAQAVRDLDKSKDKSSYARGGALLQDMSSAGKEVLGDKVPDSGTPYRVAAMAGLSGAGYQLVDPMLGVGLAGASLPYTSFGRQIAATALGRRPDALRKGAAPFIEALPYATVPAIEAEKSRRKR
jgi:hypothetical protein